MSDRNEQKKGDILLEMRDLQIEGRTDDEWLRIVNGVDLTLRRGEVLGLIGESGAGKSTIGLAAMGFTRDGCRITDGAIMFDGIDLVNASEKQRRDLLGVRIAYVAQSAAAAFNPAHKLIDQHSETPVQHGVLSQDEAEADAKELYRRLDLPEPDTIGFRYPHQVSGGQLQRAMTVMALSCRPDLVIFDEPTTALDVTTQIEVLAAIKDVVEQLDAAAVYISHDLALVAQMADRIMVLRNGDLIEEGDTREMLSNPKERYTRDLLAVRTFRKADTDDATAETPLLEVRNLTAAYGKMTVLHSVNVSVPVRRTVALVGESGSGKSTTARVISGLLRPREGEVLWLGTPMPPDFRKRSKAELRRIQMIYQMPDTALNPKHRVPRDDWAPACLLSGDGPSGAGCAGPRASIVRRVGAGPVYRPPAKRALRRREATGLHCPGSSRRAGTRHLRRSDVGAGPARRRGGPEAPRSAAARVRSLLHIHHA